MTRTDLISEILLPKFKALTGVGAEDGTELVGSKATIDSVQLVSFLLDVEDGVSQKTSAKIRLISEDALSQKDSPFRTISTLADYALSLLSRAGA